MNGYLIALIGLATTVIGIYVGASFNLAQKQLLSATRLQAYLSHYGRLVVDWNAYPVTFLGEMWDKEEQAIIQRGGSAQELVALSNEKKKICEQVVEAVNNPDIVPDAAFTAVTEVVSRFKKSDIPNILDALKVGRQNMLTGQTFITDEEATCLGVYMATNAIALKMGIVELMDGLVFLMVRAANTEDAFDPKNFMSDFFKLLWRTINVSRDYRKLLRECKTFTSSSVLKLTWRNIRQGSRISRR